MTTKYINTNYQNYYGNQ